MTDFPRALLLPALACALAACDHGVPEQPEKNPDSRVSESNVYSGQVRALEKAEQVQQIILDAHKQRGEQTE